MNIVCLRGPYGEILTVRQSTAASCPAWVATHQTHTNLNGECVKAGNLRGGVVKSPSRGSNMAEYSMRSSPPPHPALLAFPDIK